MTASSPALLRQVQAFFQEYLAGQRGLSPHTIAAYRDALKLCLVSIARRTGKHVTVLTPEDLDASAILAFLDDLEQHRQNGVATRNHRLAALRTFFRYLAVQDPTRGGQYQAVLAIPQKCATPPMMEYLEVSEINAILGGIKQERPTGRRDYTMLTLLYNTGARVQEIVDLRVRALRLTRPPLVTLTGKGRKTRHVPLWSTTAALVTDYLHERKIESVPEAPVFVNARGVPLTRYGVRHIIRTHVQAAFECCPSLVAKRVSPHTFRHTTAMHLLQAGVDLTVIKSWLGHVDVMTTHGYVEADLAMKQKALAACLPLTAGRKLRRLVNRHADVIDWLESL